MSPRATAQPFAAVIVAGGGGTRLGGVDKPALEVSGATLLDRALDAVATADPVVVVGPPRPVPRPVRWAREDPPGTGPAAGLAAGLVALPDTAAVAVLAADLIGVTAGTVARLRGACLPEVDGAVLVDSEGARQWLIGVWWVASLRAALPADAAGMSLRRILGDLRIAEVAAEPGECADLDTPEDFARACGYPRR